jgi:capsular exopolysaccharide synthesis family protein
MVESPSARLISPAHPGGTLLESYRVMRANVQFASIDTDFESIVVTSTSPGEGKSITASNLAMAMALDGRRVILVDGDLRRPTLHEKFSVDQRPGLTNVLVGHTRLEDALKETEIPGLRILTAGPLPPNPAELLNSNAMRAVHRELRDMADAVIFDSPPFLATADAQVLAAMADGIIYVVQFGEAKKSAVRHAMDLINQAHARILGVVFNKIDLTSRRDDYYQGYNRYYTYYHLPQLESGESRNRATTEFEALLNGENGTGPPADTAVASVKEDRKTEEVV